MSLRTGITTGTCAAAAAKAAAIVLGGGPAPQETEIGLPGGGRLSIAIERVVKCEDESVTACVRKDAGDDPDVTHGCEVWATVAWSAGDGVGFTAGDGVGVVTRPGLQVPPGQPAINPGPRRMIEAAVREVTPRGVQVTISIPGGRELAAKTFNPRLGIEDGLSVLGTTGIVRPYCRRAIRETLRCALDVALAAGHRRLALVPGNIGAKAARDMFSLAEQQVIEVGNAWDALAVLLPAYPLDAILVVGHPGKLAKLAVGQWDTHSAQSEQATAAVGKLCMEIFNRPAPDSPTVEGIFAGLEPAEQTALGDGLAQRIRAAIAERLSRGAGIAVVLVNMVGGRLGTDGDLASWQ